MQLSVLMNDKLWLVEVNGLHFSKNAYLSCLIDVGKNSILRFHISMAKSAVIHLIHHWHTKNTPHGSATMGDKIS